MALRLVPWSNNNCWEGAGPMGSRELNEIGETCGEKIGMKTTWWFNIAIFFFSHDIFLEKKTRCCRR